MLFVAPYQVLVFFVRPISCLLSMLAVCKVNYVLVTLSNSTADTG